MLNEIRKVFDIKELNYVKAIETAYGTSALLFNAEGRRIIIEFDKDDNYYYIYESGCFFIVESIIQLSITEEETSLILEKTAISFPGKAFDATDELVISAIENS